MFIRLLSSIPPGLLVTASLLYLMNLLIVIGPGPDMSASHRLDLTFGRNVIDERVVIDDPKPEPIIPPEPLPRNKPREQDADPFGIPDFPAALPPVTDPGPGIVEFGTSDGPLVVIMKVMPVYPTSAVQKGLEGFVIVRFDVSAAGSVENVVVLESSAASMREAPPSVVSPLILALTTR